MTMIHRKRNALSTVSTGELKTDIPRDVSIRDEQRPTPLPSNYGGFSSAAAKLLLLLSILASIAPIEAETCLMKNGDCSERPSSCCPGLSCFSLGWYSQCQETIAQEFDPCCPWEDCTQKRECEAGLSCVDYDSYTQCEQDTGDDGGDDEEEEETEEGTGEETPEEEETAGEVETCVIEYGDCATGSECCSGMQCVDFGDFAQCRAIGDTSGACIGEGSTCGLSSTACCASLACVKVDGFRSECKHISEEVLMGEFYPIVSVGAETPEGETDETEGVNDATDSPVTAPSPKPQVAEQSAACAAEWHSCFLSECCGEMTCYKHEYYSECRRPSYDPDMCLGNYHQCNSSDKPCCEGLECHEIDENYSQCLVPGAETPAMSTDADGDICLALYGDCMNNDERCCSGLMCVQLNEHYAQCRNEFAGEYEECAVQSCMGGLVCVDYGAYSQCRSPSDAKEINEPEEETEDESEGADDMCVAKFGDCHGGKDCCDDLKCIKMSEEHSQCKNEFAKEWEDCSKQECKSGLVCVKYNDYFAQCRKQSDVPSVMGHLPDEDSADSDDRKPPPSNGDGSCETLWGNCHYDPESCCGDLICVQLNDYFSQCRNQCAGKYEDCKHQGCCDGLECVQQDSHYSQCLDPNENGLDNTITEGDVDICLPIWGDCTMGQTCCDNLSCVYFDETHSQCQPLPDPDYCVVEFHDCSDNPNCCSGLTCVYNGPDDIRCLSTGDNDRAAGDDGTRRDLRSLATTKSASSKLIRTGW